MKRTELESKVGSLSAEELIQLATAKNIGLSSIEQAMLAEVLPGIQSKIVEGIFPHSRRMNVDDLLSGLTTVTPETKIERKERQRKTQIESHRAKATQKGRKKEKVEETALPSDHKVGAHAKEDSKNNLRANLNIFLERKGMIVKQGRISKDDAIKRNDLITSGISDGILHKNTEMFLAKVD